MGIPPAGASRSVTSFANENGTIALSMSTSTSMQRRRRKQEDTNPTNDNTYVQKDTSEHNIDTDSSGKNGQRSTWKRKIFRGDRKRVFVKSAIAFFLLYVWISICRFEFSNFDTKHRNNDRIINTSTLSKSTLPNGSQNGVSKSKAYDSIFCRAGSNSFQHSVASSAMILLNEGQKPKPKRNTRQKPVVRVGMKKVWRFGTSYASWCQKAEKRLFRDSGKKITKSFVATTPIVAQEVTIHRRRARVTRT